MKRKQCSFLIHMFTLSTILASVAMFLYGRLASLLFTIGGSSGYIALGVFTAATAPRLIGILCFIWVFLFPILLIVSYILTFRNHYVPFCILTILDFLVVLGFTTYSIVIRNSYAIQTMLPDLIVSCFITILIVIASHQLFHRKKNI